MKFDIEIIDIDGGKPRSSCNCPVARGITRKLPTGYRALVRCTEVQIVHKHNCMNVCKVRLPYEVIDRIRDYDHGAKMEPFSFELESLCTSS